MRAPRLLALFPCVLLLTTCGLETITVVLNPPTEGLNGTEYYQFLKTTTDGDPTYVTSTTSDDVEPQFKGFELYYKFYSSSWTPEPVVYAYDDLAAKGYRRVNGATDKPSTMSISRPLIPVASADRYITFTVKINLANIVQADQPHIAKWYPPVPDETVVVTDFRRAAVSAAVDEFKRFSDFDPDDVDVPEGLDWTHFEIGATLDLYALSYGYDPPPVNKRLYSEPVWLGTITKDFVP